MKLSVITPSFNQCRYLRQTIASVLSQSGPFELEWIIIDGGSTDGTVGLLEGINDSRVDWVSEPDRGQSHAINKGLSRATGGVLAWLNSDDLYTPGALSLVADAFTEHPDRDWLIGRCDIIDHENQEVRRWVTGYKNQSLKRYSFRRLLRENFVPQPAVFWRRGAMRAVGPLDESLYFTMDYDLWLRLGRLGRPIILDRVLAQFRLHPASKTGQCDSEQFYEQFRVAGRYFGDDRLSPVIHRLNIAKTLAAYRVMRLMKM